MKKTIGQVLLGVVSLFLSFSGAMFLFAPDRAAGKLLLEPQGVEGLSNFRAFVGAPVLAVGISLMVAAVTTRLDGARAAALFVLFILLGRTVGIAMDGAPPNIALYMTVPGLVLVAMLVAHKLIDMGKAEEAGQG